MSRRGWVSVLLAGLFLALIAPVIARGEVPRADIRFNADARGARPWAGEEIRLNLELWSDGFSFGGQTFSLPEVQGGYLIQPDSSTIKLSEVRGDTTWQGLRYTLLLFAQRGGQLEVPPFDVSFTVSAGFGKPVRAFSFTTQPFYVDVRTPPGVGADELLVTSSEFRLNWSWSPAPTAEQPLELKVGDAFTLHVERRAEHVPGMVFAPLPIAEPDGLAAYPDKPRVEDRVDRGDFTGARVDSITYMCEREGQYELPAIRFQWWDPQREVLGERVIPALTLDVAPNPALAAEESPGANPKSSAVGQPGIWRTLGVLAIALIALWVPGRQASIWLMAAWRRWREAVEAGEPWSFRQVRRSCHKGDAAEAYDAISTWLGRVRSPGRVRTLLELAAAQSDRELALEAQALQGSVVNEHHATWDGKTLLEILVHTRARLLRFSKPRGYLAPLNPAPVSPPKDGIVQRKLPANGAGNQPDRS